MRRGGDSGEEGLGEKTGGRGGWTGRRVRERKKKGNGGGVAEMKERRGGRGR